MALPIVHTSQPILVSGKIARCTSRFSSNFVGSGLARTSVSIQAQARPRYSNASTSCRAGGQDKYGHCKCTEDAVMAIMKDAIQHCLNSECDGMRYKVVDQMGKGLAALCRVSVGVAAPVPNQLASIKNEDLEQVRRMLQLTALPFNNAYDEDLQRLLKLLQTDDGTLSGSDLSQVVERLGSDLTQVLGPLIMCFPELPLWAKHRALLLPAEVAGTLAFSLLSGFNRR